MDIIVGGRQAGKTNRLLEWVKSGNRVPYYPYYDRIILTSTIREALRLQRRLAEMFQSREEADAAHRIYSWLEYQRGRFANGPVDIMVDDIEMLFAELFKQQPPMHRVVGATTTAHVIRIDQQDN